MIIMKWNEDGKSYYLTSKIGMKKDFSSFFLFLKRIMKKFLEVIVKLYTLIPNYFPVREMHITIFY